MGSAWGQLGLAIGGAVIGAMFGMPQIGFLAGSFLGGMLFKEDYKSEMPPVHDYPIQSSSIGIPLSVVLGTGRVAGNVVWMGPLQPYHIAHKAEGGKGGGGKKQVTYELRYKRSFLLALCEGHADVLRAWKGKKLISISDFTIYTGDNNSGISTLLGENYAEYSNVCLAYFEDYELGNAQALPNFVFEVSNVTSNLRQHYNTNDDAGAGFIYGSGETLGSWMGQTFTVSAAHRITHVKIKIYRLGLPGVIQCDLYNTVFSAGFYQPTGSPIASGSYDGDTVTVSSAGEWITFTFDSGVNLAASSTYALILKAPSGYNNGGAAGVWWRMDSSSPTYSDGTRVQLLSQIGIWQHAGDAEDMMFEEWGAIPGGDMNFAQMIKDLLINERYGGYSESDLITEDFDSVITYCDDNDLKGSVVIKEQKPLPDWISYICSHFQGYFYEIGGKIGLNCYRDQASVLSIVQDDLIREGDEPPVHITKRKYETTYNRSEASWTDRDNGYKTAVVPAFDRIDQREAAQVRTKTINLEMIMNQTLASKMAWRLFIDQFYRFSQYSFKLGYKSMLLEVGDVIDVTDGHLLTAKKMRVMNIEEEQDGRKATISAIEDISNLYPALSYTIQQTEYAGDDPIVLTDGTVVFREGWDTSKLYLSIKPGGVQCNGFYVYISYDNASYELLNRASISGITGGDANSTGTIQSTLPAYTTVIHRPDDYFDVSIGTLTDLDTSITDDDFFNNRKLARIGNEIIGYQTCVESAVEGTWQVSNLIRGLFGTEPVAHVSGETFSTLDISFIYNLQDSDIGKTLYFKIVSYYADEIQSLADVSSQSYTVSGDYKKPLPVSLMRINGREGLSTYQTVDVTLDWYFCSKLTGFGRGGYGNALWGTYTKDPLLENLRVELEETDGTTITEVDYVLDLYGEPTQLEILQADRNGNNPIVVKLTPGSQLLSGEDREITIEKI